MLHPTKPPSKLALAKTSSSLSPADVVEDCSVIDDRGLHVESIFDFGVSVLSLHPFIVILVRLSECVGVRVEFHCANPAVYLVLR